MRSSGRRSDELRPLSFVRHFTCHAEGSVLVAMGETRVLCTVSVEERVPGFLLGQKKGWITAEYGMLPRSTQERTPREAAKGKQGGRTLEIQRLIGRSLRAVVDLAALGERSLLLDCDVLQADGGTRTASINGAWVALQDAFTVLGAAGKLATDPMKGQLAAVSVGIYSGIPLLDLDYAEDSSAETDMNVVMNNKGEFIEIQGTAESHAFQRKELTQLLDLAEAGIGRIMNIQSDALAG